MKTTIRFLALLLIASCSKDNVFVPGDFTPTAKPPVAEEIPIKTGSIFFKGSIESPDTSDLKVYVPVCSDNPPVSLIYKISNASGQTSEKMVPIDFDGTLFTTQNPVLMDVGTYTLEDVYLVDASANITHSVPRVDDLTFPFYEYVDTPMPAPLNIVEGDNVMEIETLCYHNEYIEILPDLDNFQTVGNVAILTAGMFFNNFGSCVDRITFQLLENEGIKEPHPILLTEGQLFVVHIPINTEILINTYDGENFIERIVFVQPWEFRDVEEVIIIDCED